MENKLPNLFVNATKTLPYFKPRADADLFRIGISNITIKAMHNKKNYLVKFAIAPASRPSVAVQVDYEQKIAQKIRHLELSPRFYHFGQVRLSGRAFPYSIQEFIVGNDVHYAIDLTRIARALFVLHSGTRSKSHICNYRVLDPVKYLQKYAKSDLDRNKRKNKTEKLIHEFTKKAKRMADSHVAGRDYFCLIHNDLTAENMLIKGNRALLLDFGWAMYSAAAFDLSNFLSPFTTSWTKRLILNKHEVADFLKKYFAHHKRSDRLLILNSFKQCWLAYNSLLINWIYFDFLRKHPLHEKLFFSENDYLAKAFDQIDKVQKMLENPKFI
jgi:thiamine kinase-like enzyme